MRVDSGEKGGYKHAEVPGKGRAQNGLEPVLRSELLPTAQWRIFMGCSCSPDSDDVNEREECSAGPQAELGLTVSSSRIAEPFAVQSLIGAPFSGMRHRAQPWTPVSVPPGT
jgi:hypothetical protein